jgi:hypothetical protein
MITFTFPVLEVSRIIHAPLEEVWELLVNTSRWHEWGPSVRSVDCLEEYIKKGIKGRVQTVVGIWIPFEITKFTDNYYWAWSVSGVHATGHRVELINEKQCRLIFEVPLLAAPYVTVCKIAAKRIEKLLQRQ